MASNPIVELQSVGKEFGGFEALRAITLSVYGGEILGLVGANGAGKSTLVKLLAGYHRPSMGSIKIRGGQLPDAYGPSMARQLGMHFVHQDAPLIDNLNVLENLAWISGGYSKNALGGIRWREQQRLAMEALAGFTHAPALDALAGDLSPAERTTVVLAGLLEAATEPTPLLVLDEPTASLTPNEAASVLQTLRHAARGGAGIIFISHRLDEVAGACDRVAVLRDGSLAHITDGAVDRGEILQAMFGHDQQSGTADKIGNVSSLTTGPSRLNVERLYGRRVADLSLSVTSGEILGIAGLQGCGRSELGRLLAGVQRPSKGRITIDGRESSFEGIREAQRAGVAYVPADRLGQGVISGLTVRDNIMLRPGRWASLFWTTVGAEAALVEPLVRRFGVRPATSDMKINELSGGNQQKCVLAKWIVPTPAVLILDEPTRGVDIAAKAEIYGLLRETAQGGTAVLVLSSEADELAALCTSVVVLRHGRLAAHLTRDEISEKAILDVG